MALQSHLSLGMQLPLVLMEVTHAHQEEKLPHIVLDWCSQHVFVSLCTGFTARSKQRKADCCNFSETESHQCIQTKRSSLRHPERRRLWFVTLVMSLFSPIREDLSQGKLVYRTASPRNKIKWILLCLKFNPPSFYLLSCIIWLSRLETRTWL